MATLLLTKWNFFWFIVYLWKKKICLLLILNTVFKKRRKTKFFIQERQLLETQLKKNGTVLYPKWIKMTFQHIFFIGKNTLSSFFELAKEKLLSQKYQLDDSWHEKWQRCKVYFEIYDKRWCYSNLIVCINCTKRNYNAAEAITTRWYSKKKTKSNKQKNHFIATKLPTSSDPSQWNMSKGNIITMAMSSEILKTTTVANP